MTTIFVLFSVKPTSDDTELVYFSSSDTYSGELEFDLNMASEDLDPGALLIVTRFAGEQAETLQTLIRDLKNGDFEDGQLEKIETTLLGFLYPTEPNTQDEPDDSMDGDHESALASAGFGTDEDYGFQGDDV